MEPTTFHIAVLNLNEYEVDILNVDLAVPENQSEVEAVEEYLSEIYNLDEIQFMFGYEPIAVNDDHHA